MEVVEAHFDEHKVRSVEFYQDDDDIFHFEEWSAGGDESERGWITAGHFASRAFATLQEARQQAAHDIAWFDAISE
jgi:hypothetical protein